MKKIILSMAMLATVAFTGCSNDDDEPKCKTCEDVLLEGYDLEFCDNGDNTITVTGTFNGVEAGSETIEFSEGENFEDYDCSRFDDLGFDFTAITK